MQSPMHRLAKILMLARIPDVVLARLPEPMAHALREVRDALADSDAEPSVEVRRGPVERGESVGAAAFVLGPVREGASVRAVDVLDGAVDGGTVRAVNLLRGDVLYGDVRAVNVLVGNVRGGTLRGVHLIVGDVFGGTFERCYTVIGDVHGGTGRIARVIGEVLHDGIEVGERVER